MRIMLAGLCLLIVVSIIALLTTSSGIMIYQVKAGTDISAATSLE